MNRILQLWDLSDDDQSDGVAKSNTVCSAERHLNLSDGSDLSSFFKSTARLIGIWVLPLRGPDPFVIVLEQGVIECLNEMDRASEYWVKG
jgi:hypothetical protein